MIKKWPGWLNYLALWGAYMVFGFGLYYLFRWMSGAAIEPMAHMFIVFYIFIQTAVHSGMYLAKWRFHDGGWRFW